MGAVKSFDHIGVTVRELDPAIRFFEALGLEQRGRVQGLAGDFIDTVCGIPGSTTTIVMLGVPGQPTGIELSCFDHPPMQPGDEHAMANVQGLRSLAFEVHDLPGTLARLAELGYGLIGGVGEYEQMWSMAYVRGPEGLIIALAQRL